MTAHEEAALLVLDNARLTLGWAVLRDRRTGKERVLTLEPAEGRRVWLWTEPKTIYVQSREDPRRRFPVRHPARRLHQVAMDQLVWNQRLARFEVRL